MQQNRLILFLILLGLSAPSARAETAPDSFREKVIDTTTHCYPIYSRLAETYWPDRDPAEVAELKEDARAKRDYALDMLRRYSAVYSNFSINEQIEKAGAEISVDSVSKETLLDLAILCEDTMFPLIDEESEKGYTP